MIKDVIIVISAILFMVFVGLHLIPMITYVMGIGVSITIILMMFLSIVSLIFGLWQDQKGLR